LIIFQGCSLIGLAIGASGDKSKKGYAESFGELLVLEKDKICRITLKSGEIDSAKFVGFDKLSDDEYRIRYSKSRLELQDSLTLPELGNVIAIIRDEKRTEVNFKGFDANYVLIEVDDKREPIQLSYSYMKSSLIQDSHNNIIEFAKIDKLIVKRKIALLTIASFKTGQGIHKIPLDELLRADFEVKKYGAPIGFLFGAIVDALLIYTISKSPFDVVVIIGSPQAPASRILLGAQSYRDGRQ